MKERGIEKGFYIWMRQIKWWVIESFRSWKERACEMYGIMQDVRLMLMIHLNTKMKSIIKDYIID